MNITMKIRELKFTIRFMFTFIKYLPKALKLIAKHGSYNHGYILTLGISQTGEILSFTKSVKLDDGTKYIYSNIITNEEVTMRD